MTQARPNLRWWAAAYIGALLAMGLLDGLWLGVVATDFYRGEIGALMVDPPRWVPAALFYLLYPLGLVGLGLTGPRQAASQAALRCAALGLLAYGTYDLSNLATLAGWTTRLALVDIAWGTAASCLAGVFALRVARRFSPRATEP